MGKEGLGYEEWNKVVEDCDRQFDQIAATRKNMILAEMIQKKIKSFALIERRKFPEPAIKMEETEKPAEAAPEAEAETPEEPTPEEE